MFITSFILLHHYSRISNITKFIGDCRQDISNANRSFLSMFIPFLTFNLVTNSTGHSNPIWDKFFKLDRDDATEDEVVKKRLAVPKKRGQKRGDKTFKDCGYVNSLVPRSYDRKGRENHGLRSLHATPNNMCKVHYIQLTREYCHVLWEVCAFIFPKFPTGEMRRLLDNNLFVKNLHCKPNGIHQRTKKFFDLLELGVYDDFELYLKHANDGYTNFKGKMPLFVNQVVFIWPLVCGCMRARNFIETEKDKYAYGKYFRGNAATTFRNIVRALGFTTKTYPYYEARKVGDSGDTDADSDIRVLRVWRGANFKR